MRNTTLWRRAEDRLRGRGVPSESPVGPVVIEDFRDLSQADLKMTPVVLTVPATLRSSVRRRTALCAEVFALIAKDGEVIVNPLS